MSKVWSNDFLELALEYGALRFGEFTLKSGRISPYFFNAGHFNDGAGIDRLARCYAASIVASGVAFDGLFGPAYKGIPLAAAVAISLQRDFQLNVPFSFDRKEAKDHGEGGIIVGAPLSGRILIIDDVISAGTSVRASCELIEAHGATPAAVAIALDRQEKGQDQRSAVDAVRASGLDVISVASLSDLIDWLGQQSFSATQAAQLEAMRRYREQYGV
ncbi:MAG: orotate phosphoribosyltransferase [Wenzhouxiangella sp.]